MIGTDGIVDDQVPTQPQHEGYSSLAEDKDTAHEAALSDGQTTPKRVGVVDRSLVLIDLVPFLGKRAHGPDVAERLLGDLCPASPPIQQHSFHSALTWWWNA